MHYSQDKRQIDLDNPVEALMQFIAGWQAGEDHQETVRKLAEGRWNRAAMDKRVVPLGLSPPFGYKKVKNGKKTYFEEDLIQSNIVRKIFTWYVYGNGDGKPMSLSGIAKSLTEEGNNPTSGDIHSKRSKKRGYGVGQEAR